MDMFSCEGTKRRQREDTYETHREMSVLISLCFNHPRNLYVLSWRVSSSQLWIKNASYLVSVFVSGPLKNLADVVKYKLHSQDYSLLNLSIDKHSLDMS